MNTYHNDQAHIAGEFLLTEDHTVQIARLASFKISSYKISLHNAAFCMTRDELSAIIKNSLLNYTDSGRILADLGFFDSEVNN